MEEAIETHAVRSGSYVNGDNERETKLWSESELLKD